MHRAFWQTGWWCRLRLCSVFFGHEDEDDDDDDDDHHDDHNIDIDIDHDIDHNNDPT